MNTVADQFADTLAAAGVKRIYGVVGDSLNGLTDALRRQGKIEWVHVRHEEVAAFAAGAEAHVTGALAVPAAVGRAIWRTRWRFFSPWVAAGSPDRAVLPVVASVNGAKARSSSS